MSFTESDWTVWVFLFPDRSWLVVPAFRVQVFRVDRFDSGLWDLPVCPPKGPSRQPHSQSNPRPSRQAVGQPATPCNSHD